MKNIVIGLWDNNNIQKYRKYKFNGYFSSSNYYKMERKSLEVESMDHQKLSSAVYDGSVTAVDSVKEDVQETKVVYRGWKVMPYIIGNAIILSFTVLYKLSSF